MNSFKTGVFVGVLSSVAVAAAAALSYHQTVIKPAEEAEEHHEEVSKQAIRRSVAAHQSRY
ncbi:DUF3042 family protein [Leuconostoc carnosum]|uniref:DUF3042 family protein n=1 Tax=Leuconostoc TaxID=1243 RepID=UPI0002F50652|nr:MULTISPECIES: DUF3042 family protein [Leuconostoc]KAA8325617.1 DUF3042 family protein [Leuconostoc carnosum]KAA8359838.1 DUF3042 family protein [Leuconostoc carnosum]KAA8365413.1 DUF3042 family protein [Leuconostoc carnosum]KAA8367783.1 DUF3042 family protein [Leuconostoc carnosum]KAA8371263.1 DUF3042 family protein [Leuconostoc carnosum]